MDASIITSHIFASETDMPVARLMNIHEKEVEQRQLQVLRKDLPNSEDTLEPLQNVLEDVPGLRTHLLDYKAPPRHLTAKAQSALGS